MKRRLFVWAGALIAAVGFIWTLQGLGYVGGSAMTGETVWAVVGPVVIVAGLVLATIGLRGGQSRP